MVKSADPRIQRVRRENTDLMLLVNFVSGLTGVPGLQARFSNPRQLVEAFTITLPIQEAERQGRFNESFYTRFEKSVRLLSKPQGRPDPSSGSTRHSCDLCVGSHARSQPYSAPASAARSEPQSSRKHRPKLPYAVTSAMAGDISQRNARLGLKRY